MVKTSIKDGVVGVEGRRLLQIAYAQVVAEDNLSAVVALLTCDNGEQRALSRSVLGDEAYLLALGNGERDVFEQHLGAERLREILYVDKRIRHSDDSA